MSTQTPQAGGHITAISYDNHLMTESAQTPASWLRRALVAPFTKRARAEVGYTVISFLLAVAAVAFIVPMLENGIFWAISTTPVRKLGGGARFLARAQLGEDIPAMPPMRPTHFVKVATPDAATAAGLARAVAAAGGKAREWESKPGLTTRLLPPPQVAELAAAAGIAETSVRPRNDLTNYFGTRIRDTAGWRARAYFLVKLPLGALGMAVIAIRWLGGLFLLTFPAWRALGLQGFGGLGVDNSLAAVLFGILLLFSAPWATHALTRADLWLMRALLVGPASSTERIQVLERSRARVVDDSAARLRGIERDLHDGTQGQLVAVAMKLGLARDKLYDASGIDLARVTQLVEDAHRGALEAIADLRTLARGIHPPVLDNGLPDALATLADPRSARARRADHRHPGAKPSAAIRDHIAYFSAAELLANGIGPAQRRQASLPSRPCVPGLLRLRVTDDGPCGWG